LETYIIEGNAGTGAIEINGAAAHLVKEGDEVIIIAFALGDQPISPKAVLVDKHNKFVRYLDEKQGTVV
ncbi:MAG: aspartate 1-decarboxylase, partial [Gammaproteobacteria bacterium]